MVIFCCLNTFDIHDYEDPVHTSMGEGGFYNVFPATSGAEFSVFSEGA
jgi:hypothetical protein